MQKACLGSSPHPKLWGPLLSALGLLRPPPPHPESVTHRPAADRQTYGSESNLDPEPHCPAGVPGAISFPRVLVPGV